MSTPPWWYMVGGGVWARYQVVGGGGCCSLPPGITSSSSLAPTNVKQGPKVAEPFKKEGGKEVRGRRSQSNQQTLQLIDDFFVNFYGLKYGWPSGDFSLLNPDPIPGVSRHPTSDSQLQILGLASANPLPSPHWSSVRRELSYWLESGPSGPGLAGARRRRERRGGGVPPPPPRSHDLNVRNLATCYL
jgi:hypothetical protein